MEEIDRLGWAAERSLSCYGVPIGIRASEPAVLEDLQERLPPDFRPARARRVERVYSLVAGGPAAARGIRHFNLLYVNEVRLARSLGLPEVLRAFEMDVERYVAEHARRRLFLHAGVVGWQGRAIVIPGQSMSGKSSLVAALLEAGATYYSDEYAVLDDHGLVHPYPRALCLRDAPATAPRPPAVSGGKTPLAPLPVGLVLVSRYRAGARWRPRALSPGRAGIELLAHTVAARRRPAGALAVLARALSGARALKGARGEAGALVETLLGARAGGDGARRPG
jgi:hypothetical protein